MTESINPSAVLDPMPRIKLTSPADLVETVPYLVGFPPQRSIVLICVRDGLLRLTMRADLPATRHASEAAAWLTRHAKKADAQFVLVACYPEGERERKAAATVVRRLRRELRSQNVHVKEAVRVEDGRWWSYLCERPTCCPPDGTPVRERPGPAVAAAVLAGMNLLPGRDALYERLAPVDAATLDAVKEAAEEAIGVLVYEVDKALGEDGTIDDDRRTRLVSDWRAKELAFMTGLLDRYGADGGGSSRPLEPAEAGRALFGLFDLKLRDSCALWWQDRESTHRAVGLWTDLVRHAPLELVPPAATLLAASAWLTGEGAFANVALELALKADPEYSLAQLLETGIQGGVTPDEMREAFNVPPALLA